MYFIGESGTQYNNKSVLITVSPENTLVSVSLWKYSCMTYEWVDVPETNKFYKQVKNNLEKVIKHENFNSFTFEKAN